MIKVCVICKKEFKTYRSSQQTCSKKCMGINRTGSNNPNYGNSWTDEQKQIASDLKKEQFNNNPEYAYTCGKSNRGIKFSKDRVAAMHNHRSSESYKHPHTLETKKIIGQKSKNKWTQEYRVRHRKKMEETGHWVRLEDKDPYDIYYKESNWQHNMIQFFNIIEYENLNEHGIFSKHNVKGWVRDHIVPRKVGYEYGLPPYILRHPANLQFISHSKNISKGFADRRLTNKEKEHIIDVLLEKILNFKTEWPEQEICLDYIRNKK